MGRRGHFCKERYSYKIVKGMAHKKESILYFLKNPVRAGMVKNPLDHPHSFVHAIIGQPGYKDPSGHFHLLDQEIIDYVMNFINQFVEVAKDGVKTMKNVSEKLYNSMMKKRSSIQFSYLKKEHLHRYRNFSMSMK